MRALSSGAAQRGLGVCLLCGRRARRQASSRGPVGAAAAAPPAGAPLKGGRVAQPPADGVSTNRPSTRNTLQPRGEGPATLQFFATCAPGLEAVLASELVGPHIGAVNVRPGRAGVSFSGSQGTGMRAVLWLRTAIRVLLKLASGDLVPRPGVRGADALYDFIRKAAEWKHLLPRGQTFSVNARVWDCLDLPSEALAATRAKDAICDALRDATGDKPQAPPSGSPGDLPLFLTCHRDKALLYRDLCGSSLHKRGYRAGDAIHRAALNETVAAGVAALLNWPGAPQALHPAPIATGAMSQTVVVDPMCGSGTLLIEAAMMATHRAPGLLRSSPWPFQAWPDMEPGTWHAAVEEARQAVVESPGQSRVLLFGADSHGGALALAQSAAARAGVDHLIQFQQADVRAWAPPLPQGAAVTHVAVNPPWGGRLQGGSSPDGAAPSGTATITGDGFDEDGDLLETWFQLGMFLKRHCAGAEVGVLTANREAAAKLFLSPKRKLPLTVGGIDCRLLTYTMLPPKVKQ